jgi:hypothetical protein
VDGRAVYDHGHSQKEFKQMDGYDHRAEAMKSLSESFNEYRFLFHRTVAEKLITSRVACGHREKITENQFRV